MKSKIIIATLMLSLPVLTLAEKRNTQAENPEGADMYDSASLIPPSDLSGGLATPPAPPPPPPPPPPGPACGNIFVRWYKCASWSGTGSTGQVRKLKNDDGKSGYYGRWYLRCTNSGWVEDGRRGGRADDDGAYYCGNRYGDIWP